MDRDLSAYGVISQVTFDLSSSRALTHRVRLVLAPSDDAVVIRRALDPSIRVCQPRRARRRPDTKVPKERVTRSKVRRKGHTEGGSTTEG